MVLWCLVTLALRTLCSAPACATQHKQQTCGFLNALTDIWSVWGGTYELSLWCASSLHPVWKYSSDILQSCMLQWGTLLASSCSPPLCLSRNAHVLQWWSDGDPRRAQYFQIYVILVYSKKWNCINLAQVLLQYFEGWKWLRGGSSVSQNSTSKKYILWF